MDSYCSWTKIQYLPRLASALCPFLQLLSSTFPLAYWALARLATTLCPFPGPKCDLLKEVAPDPTGSCYTLLHHPLLMALATAITMGLSV